jgi:tRNA threonylcarbamoyladenosine biosynthesis protein TsaB
MIVLAIETATTVLSCALCSSDGVLASFVSDEGQRHTEQLAPAIEDLGRQAGVRLGDLDAVAVDVGPGLFTGLRVGIATATALGSALVRPVVGLTSTDVVAQPHHRPGRVVVAVIDARRGEVAWVQYQSGGATGPPALATPDALCEVLSGLARTSDEIFVVGDGATRYSDALSDGLAVTIDVATPHPLATVLGQMAITGLETGHLVPGDVEPRYLRQADVRIRYPVARPA